MKKLCSLLLAVMLLIGRAAIPAMAEPAPVILIGLQTSSDITDYEDNYFTNLLETEGNVEIEFQFLPSSGSDTKNKLALMISGGEKLPDVIVTSALDHNSILDYGSKGVFLALDDYLSDGDMAEYFSHIPQEDREKMLEDVRSADGRIYGLPRYTPSAWSSTNKRMWINEAWLETLGMDMPTTIDELEAVLEAFVTQDPNGNGIADEIGIYGRSSMETICSLMNSFVYCSYLNELALSDDGAQVIAPYATDAYREGLRWFHKMFQKGLLNENLFTDEQTTMVATMNGDINVVGLCALGSFPTLWPGSALGTNENVKEYDMLAPLTGPEGIAYAPHVNQDADARWFITKDAEDPEMCFKLGDLHYRADIGLAARYGNADNIITDLKVLEENGWTNSYKEMGIVDHLLLRINGNINATATNEYWRDIGPRYASAIFDMSYSAIVENDDTTSNVSTFHGKNYLYNVNARPEYLLPTLKYTTEEQNAMSDPQTNIKSYVNQCVALFTLGGMDIETEWDAYLAELDRLGLPTLLETAQTAYDRTK